MAHPQRERARQLRREGCTLAQIAEARGVTKPCVSKWCRDLPEHAAATEQNALASYAARKILPRGTENLNEYLRKLGLPFSERLKITREAAAADTLDKAIRAVGGREAA